MSVFYGAVGHEINSEAMKAASWVSRACLVVENRKQKRLSILRRPLVAGLEKRPPVHGLSGQASAISSFAVFL